MRHLLSLLIYLIANGSAFGQLRADTVATSHEVLGATCAIFPAAAALPPWLQDEKVRIERFTPTLAQVQLVEQALRRQNLGAAAPRPEFSDYYAHYPALIQRNLPRYHRQYFGYYNDQRHPCLYLNAFVYDIEDLPGTVPHWLRETIWTNDGGAAYWRICYDLTVQKFYCFNHNHEG